jgi:hypothetical protein
MGSRVAVVAVVLVAVAATAGCQDRPVPEPPLPARVGGAHLGAEIRACDALATFGARARCWAQAYRNATD